MQAITFNGREYLISGIEAAGEFLKAEMTKNGLDGNVYHATSKPVGRQRKTLFMSFVKGVKSGQFIPAL